MAKNCAIRLTFALFSRHLTCERGAPIVAGRAEILSWFGLIVLTIEPGRRKIGRYETNENSFLTLVLHHI